MREKMILTWQEIVFIVLDKITMGGKARDFSRSQLLSQLDTAEKLSAVFGHKKFPQRVEQTIQKTLQTMRDKGFIEFKAAYSGLYRLTDPGNQEMSLFLTSLRGE